MYLMFPFSPQSVYFRLSESFNFIFPRLNYTLFYNSFNDYSTNYSVYVWLSKYLVYLVYYLVYFTHLPHSAKQLGNLVSNFSMCEWITWRAYQSLTPASHGHRVIHKWVAGLRVCLLPTRHPNLMACRLAFASLHFTPQEKSLMSSQCLEWGLRMEVPFGYSSFFPVFLGFGTGSLFICLENSL